MANQRNLKSKLAESHRRQFDGEDYQAVAIELSTNDDEYSQLTSSPDPECDCDFCKTAEFID